MSAKTLKPGAVERPAEIGELKPEARVRAVRAEAGHRLGVGHPRPRRSADPEPGLGEHRAEHRLGHLQDVVLLDERHLDVELGELGHPVRPGVLVAEAAHDLEVALKAPDHEQLLEQLRRLGQGIERARGHARGHEEVARALRGRAGQERRLDLQEVERVELAPDDLADPVAQGDGVLQRRAAQVQGAVAQAQVLIHGAVLVDREGRRVGVGEDLQGAHGELDLAAGQVRVDVLGRAALDLPRDGDHVLGAQPVRGGVRLGGVGRVKDELQQARALAQVDEDQTAVVAAAVHPAGHAGLRAGPGGVELGDPGVAVEVGPRAASHRGHQISRLPRRMVGITDGASISICSEVSMFLRLISGSSETIAT